jgi:putative transposase
MSLHSFYLTPTELKQIEAAMQQQTKHMEVRFRAIALYRLHKSESFSRVAKDMNIKTRATLYNWIKRFRQDGVEGLVNKPKSNLIDEGYRETLKQVVSMKPSDFNIPMPEWSLPALNAVMQKAVGITIRDIDVRDLLKELGV